MNSRVQKAEFQKAQRCTLQWIILPRLCLQIRSIKVKDAQSHTGLRANSCGNRTKTNWTKIVKNIPGGNQKQFLKEIESV